MPSAAALRFQIETALATRIPGALTPRPRILRDLAATGIEEIDALLEGGLPIGAITELVGAHSSGRTTLALAAIAEMTQAGKTVAWIDASDTLDPESAAAAGVDLARQLWVRCGHETRSVAQKTFETNEGSHGKGAALLVEGSRTPVSSGGCGSPHPRGEARGLSEAIDAFLHPDVFSRPAPPRDPAVPRKSRMIGTPSAPNRKLLDRTPQDARPMPRRARDREEQVPTDRQPSRRQSLQAQRNSTAEAKHLASAQIANTASVAMNRPQAGAWTDNKNNAAGRSLATPPNAIAAGLPRFREMEARAQGQGHGLQQKALPWKPVWKGQLPPEGAKDGKQAESSSETPSPKRVLVKTPSEVADVAGNTKETQASLAGESPNLPGRKSSPIWRALDQALRATDLLLSAGGFSAIVLDLGNILPEFAWRIPLATWFRFRAAADRARTVLLLLTQHPCARSSAELVLRFDPVKSQSAATVLTGAQFRISVDRRRFETSPAISVAQTPAPPHTLHLVTSRKQAQRERAVAWNRAATWTGTEPPKTRAGRP